MALHTLFLYGDMRSCKAAWQFDMWSQYLRRTHDTYTKACQNVTLQHGWQNVWHWDTWHTLHYWLHQYTMTFIMFSYNLSTFFIAILPLPSTTILFAILMFFAEIIAICKKFEVFTVEIPKLFDQIEKVSKNIYFSIE